MSPANITPQKHHQPPSRSDIFVRPSWGSPKIHLPKGRETDRPTFLPQKKATTWSLHGRKNGAMTLNFGYMTRFSFDHGHSKWTQNVNPVKIQRPASAKAPQFRGTLQGFLSAAQNR